MMLDSRTLRCPAGIPPVTSPTLPPLGATATLWHRAEPTEARDVHDLDACGEAS